MRQRKRERERETERKINESEQTETCQVKINALDEAATQHVSRISHPGLQCLSIFCMMLHTFLQMQVKTSM